MSPTRVIFTAFCSIKGGDYLGQLSNYRLLMKETLLCGVI
jgi:hypothetical protein